MTKDYIYHATLSGRVELHWSGRFGKYDKGGHVLSLSGALAYIWAWKRLQACMHCNGHENYRSYRTDASPLPSIPTRGQRGRHRPNWLLVQDASTGHNYRRTAFRWIVKTCSCLPIQMATLNHVTAYLYGTWAFHKMDLNYIR